MAKYDDGLGPVATALAHPGRRQIIDRLTRGSATSTQLADLLGIGLPALAKHTALLTEAGVVHADKQGRTVHHHLEPAGLTVMSDWLTTRRTFWAHQLDNLADHWEQP